MWNKEDFIHYTGDNLNPDGVEAQKCLDILGEFFLGSFYIVGSMSLYQANVIITNEIMSRFPKKYKKFCKKKGWSLKRLCSMLDIKELGKVPYQKYILNVLI